LLFLQVFCIIAQEINEGNIQRMKRIFAAVLCIAMLCGSPVVNAQEAVVSVEKDTLLSALYEADISAMQEALSLGLVTSEELTQYYLQRIEDYNEPYNCFITICDNALEVARQRDADRKKGLAEGALFGIPIVVKDNMDYEGYHTTNGYYKKDSQIAKENADVVQAFVDAGAVILAKANMSTAAQDALCSKSQVAGETKNAYNTTMAAGGSSGGSAVATSLNFAAAALGTDTNSSLRIPAALNGCVSLRPTFGLLSNKGIKRLNSTRDTAGAITRTVYDQALMLDVLTGGTHHYTENLNGQVLTGMRIGILEELSYATSKEAKRKESNLDKEVSEAFANAVKELESLGAEVVSVSFPKLFSLSNRTFSSGDATYKEALYNAYLEVLEENDVSVLIYPSYLSAPIRSGVDENGKNWSATSQVNINNCRTLSPSAGLPEITVPIGVHSRGSGIGMEIAAPKNCEQLLLDIAYSYTQSYDHRQAPEGAPDSYQDANQGSLPAVIDDYLYRVAQMQTEPTTLPEETVTALETVSSAVEATPVAKQNDTLLLYAVLAATGLMAVIVLVLIIKQSRRNKHKEPVA